MKISNSIRAAVLSIAAVLATAAHAASIDVSWVATGQAGDWTVDFTVGNNLQPGAQDMAIYQFGVYTAERNIVGSPTGWDPDYLLVRTDYYAFYPYNNIWTNFPDSDLTPGANESGFKLKVATLDAPTVFDWYAIAYSPTGGEYLGMDQTFGGALNPAFQRTTVQAVPEPSALVMLLAGGALLSLRQATRRRAG